MSIDTASPCSICVAGVYGKKPTLFMVSMSSHDQNDFVSVDVFAASSALSLTALNDMPGGSIRPFCAPPTVTSTPHSSWRESAEAGEGVRSHINKTGWAGE